MSLFLLPHLGLIRVIGAEARSFLQNQLSNDANAVSPQRAQLSGYCSPKGRLLAALTVAQLGTDDFLLVLPQALLAPTLKRLKMFVLRSKVLLEEETALRALGSLGERTEAAEAWQVHSSGDSFWLRRPGTARHLVIAPSSIAAEDDAAAAAWRLAELEAGIPIVLPETADHFVPQTADLDLAGGISFTKGCYPGQEIVARVHYLGRLKQRLFLASSAVAAAVGADVRREGEASAVGEVMECLPDPKGGYRLSLVLQQTQADAPRLHLPDGQPVSALQAAHRSPTA